jgi:glycosyltransferase involved in cell wall biosynthesis
MKVGFTYAGSPRSPASWSGVPAALVDALERMDVSVTAIDARIFGAREHLVRGVVGLTILMSPTGPHNFGAARDNASASAQLGMMRSLSLLRHAWSLARLDGVVQIGSGYLLPPAATPYVTYEDMTVPQAVRAGYPIWSTLPAAPLRRRIEMQRRMYRRARGCCFMSHWAAASAIEDYGVDARKVHVVGVGANHIVTPTGREWYPPRFLFVGKDWQRKNGDAVVRAFSHVREEHSDARLDLVGEVPPVNADGVIVHGMLRLGDPRERERFERLLREATCFVMPSLHEPAGAAYVDAAHAGLPCIGSTAGGAEEVIGPGGIGVAPHDGHALLEAMTALSEPTLARAMGAKAHMRAQLYTWDAVAQRLLRALTPDQAVQRNLAPFL